MTLYNIVITNHSGNVIHYWTNPNKPHRPVAEVFHTRFPPITDVSNMEEVELTCMYLAATSNFGRSQNRKLKRIISESVEDMGDQDIIFKLDIDKYMNEEHLIYKMEKVTDNLLYKNRNELDEMSLSDEEKKVINNIFTDVKSRKIILNNGPVIFKTIKDVLEEKIGDREYYQYGILGVGILSASYNILFYNGLKNYLELTEEDISSDLKLKFPGEVPEGERDLDNILYSATTIPVVEGGESNFVYTPNVNLLIHNFEIGPIIELNNEKIKEPFHLAVAVRPGFPSKSTINKLVNTISPYLYDEE